MDVTLVVVNGKHVGQELRVNVPEFVIGRSKECHLRPRNEKISRRHCAVIVQQRKTLIRDFGSSNGTFLNGQRVNGEQELKSGDRLKVGDLEFEVRVAVGLGGKPKPKVKSVGEAAARMAQSQDDDLDITSWLDDLDGPAEEPTVAMPAKKKPAAAADEYDLRVDEESPKKPEPKKKPVAAKDAAAEALRSYFNRR